MTTSSHATIEELVPVPKLSRYDMDFAFHLACEYRERFSVIPMRGKRPALPWKRFQESHSRPSMDDIRRWFGREAKERFNLGILTGRAASGIVVLDADSLEAAAWWKANRPPTPLAVKTGGGHGVHFYYRAPRTPVQNRIRVLGRSLDVKGDHGVVVAPPSIHSTTGNHYLWCGSFDAYSLKALPVFDSKWVETPARPKPGNRCSFQPNSGRPLKSVRERILRVRSVSGSGGHNAAFFCACLLLEAGLSESDALAELTQWSSTNATPPWSERELAWKITSAAKHVRSKQL